MFKINNITIDDICLAPMAGYTNQAYRRVMKRMNVGLVYTEMISAKGLLYENDKTWELTKIADDEHPIALQLFGGEKDDLVKAAILVDTKTDCDIIDINMGCPIRKILKSESGSYLLQDVNKIYDIVSSITKAVKKPVSVKIRTGWDNSHINCVEVAKAIEEAGASFITIHGRTKSDLYSGKANLDYIKQVREAVTIPVIGNGDIKSIEDAIKMKEYTKVDSIMVGRATLGNPWIIRDLVDYFNNQPLKKPPTREEKIEVLKYHFKELLKLKGEKLAVLEMRSLASWYVKGLYNATIFKQALVYVKTKDQLEKIINEKL